LAPVLPRYDRGMLYTYIAEIVQTFDDMGMSLCLSFACTLIMFLPLSAGVFDRDRGQEKKSAFYVSV
jgi:hypothetical protein